MPTKVRIKTGNKQCGVERNMVSRNEGENERRRGVRAGNLTGGGAPAVEEKGRGRKKNTGLTAGRASVERWDETGGGGERPRALELGRYRGSQRFKKTHVAVLRWWSQQGSPQGKREQAEGIGGC